MQALVIVASRHGATREIGEVIAKTVADHGVEVRLVAAEEARDVPLEPFDAVIIGSPIYTGRWLPEARSFTEQAAEVLRERDVWLFSSGLSDAPAKASNRPAETQERIQMVGAIQHRHFPGKLDLSVLNFAERAIIAAARGKQGDRRPMAAVADWASEIACTIRASASA